MRDAKQDLLRAKSGMTVEIATECRAVKGSQLLKIGENGFDFTRRLKNLPGRREAIDLEINISAKTWRISSSRLAGAWEKNVKFAPAERHALDAGAVRDCFTSGAPEKFRVSEVSVTIDGNWFVPASVIKALRREFWAAVADDILPEIDRAGDAVRRFTADYEAQTGNAATAPELSAPAEFYGFVPEDKVNVEHARFDAAQKSDQTIAVAGLHALNWVKSGQGTVVTRFPIAVANSCAARLLAEMGISAVEAAPELPAREREKLAAKSPVPLLPVRDVPLLVTRLPLKTGIWHDADGHAFIVRQNGEKLYVLEEAVKNASK